METFALLTCLVCYHEGKAETFLPSSPMPGSEHECPVCRNNDSEYIETASADTPPYKSIIYGKMQPIFSSLRD